MSNIQYPQAQPAAQPVDRELHGILIGAEERNAGWYRFSIMEAGNQYPTKVDTKKPELVQQAMGLITQQIAASIREQESANINPNSGRPYINRYLNAIAPAGYAPGVQPTQQPAPQPTYGAQTYQTTQAQGQTQAATPMQPQQFLSDRDLNIMRQCASKVAAVMLPRLPEDKQTITGMIEVCEAFMAYYVHGPLRFGVTPFDTPEPPVGVVQQGGEDGIPFDPASREDVTGVVTGPMQSPLDPTREIVTDGQAQPCPDCGFVGAHALNCPEGQFV